MNDENKTDTDQPVFMIQRIYTKDLSFEAPNTPESFTQEWDPKIDINLDINTAKLADKDYEVVLKITMTAKLAEKTAFLIEVAQAGIFTIDNFPEDQIKPMLGSFCPSVLFPYAREVVSSVASRGSFPAVYLAPVDFNALYQQQLEEEEKSQ